MSNILVTRLTLVDRGTVYQRVIEDVVENNTVTFEEDGVARATLEDLKKTWQAKLSQRKVAVMPWDPPAPSSQAAPPPLPQDPNRAQARPVPLPPAASLPSNTAASTSGGAQIKPEPGTVNYDLQNLPPAQPYQVGGAQRAGELLREKFGDRAQPQVRQLQAMSGQIPQMPSGQGAPSRINVPDFSQMPEADRLALQARHQAYARAQATALQNRQAQLPGMQQNGQPNGQPRPTPVSQAQTDGSSDWSKMVAERRLLAADAAAPGGADATIFQQLQELSAQMEGNGTFTPYSQLSSHARRPPGRRVMASMSTSSPATHVTAVSANFDGAGESDSDERKYREEDEDDEDAINSDLDDPNEHDADDREDDGAIGEMMLCTYDKVQRVKNKWKCTLKDGVLTTGGKEYVFSKAQGEFEW